MTIAALKESHPMGRVSMENPMAQGVNPSPSSNPLRGEAEVGIAARGLGFTPRAMGFSKRGRT